MTFLPAPATATGNGTNVVSSATYAALPTNACSTSITNPDSSNSMLVICEWSGWFLSNSAGTVGEMCVALSGGMTVAAGVGGADQPTAKGEICYYTTNRYLQMRGACSYSIPASATVTFTLQARKPSGAGTLNVDYPSVLVVPIRFL